MARVAALAMVALIGLAVAYAIGALHASPHRAAAARYLAFLATPDAQAAYAKYGFVNATAGELALKPIP